MIGASSGFSDYRAGTRLFLGYRSFFLADFNHVSNFPLQIALYAEKDISLIVDGDALHVFQLAPERGNCFQLFTGRVDVELAVMTVSDVQRPLCEIDSLGRESIVAIDD